MLSLPILGKLVLYVRLLQSTLPLWIVGSYIKSSVTDKCKNSVDLNAD